MAKITMTQPPANILVLDLCQIPPAYTDSLGREGVIQDSWEGIESEGLICWDGTCRDTPSGKGWWVSHPASAIDTLESNSAGMALMPMFNRCISFKENSKLDKMILLAPAGLSPATGTVLRRTAAAAGWQGDIWVADGSVLFTAALARLANQKEFTCAVYRDREYLTEASLLSVQTNDNVMSITLNQQRREENLESARQRWETEGKSITHSLVRPLQADESEWLCRIVEIMALIHRGDLTLEINRCGVIGIRSEEQDLLPLVDETCDITATRSYTVSVANHDLPQIEIWFGYPGSAVHPVAEMKFVSNRFADTPRNLICHAARELDGTVDITVQWDQGHQHCRTAFPILFN